MTVKFRMSAAVLLMAASTTWAQQSAADFMNGQTAEQVLASVGEVAQVPPFVEPKLNVGDKAPALEVTEFAKGEPVPAFEEGTVYLVDFWATWCGPCIRSMPHLSELQEKHSGDGLRVIAVDIWETKRTPEGPQPILGEERTQLVANFMEKHNDNMRYTVAIDGEQKVEKAWMEAAGQKGIPTAMIVDRAGKVAWIGYGTDASMDDSLEAILAGEHDLDKARAERLDAMRTEHESMGLRGYFQVLGEYMGSGQEEKGRALMAALYETHLQKNSNVLNALAWNLVGGEEVSAENAALGKLLAHRAAELTQWKDADVLDTLAWANHHAGDHAEAVRVQTLAVEHAGNDEQRAGLTEALETFTAAAGQG